MQNHRAPRGYSLLELIVAVAIFSMVMLVVMGVYLALISYDRQARATNQLVANLDFAMESMVRMIRTGTEYTCDVSPCSSIAFRNSDDTVISYCRLADGTIGQLVGGGLNGNDCQSSSQTVRLTDPRINISSLAFYVTGVGTSGGNAILQPQVTIAIMGTMTTDSGRDIDFSIQTGATQRVLDIP